MNVRNATMAWIGKKIIFLILFSKYVQLSHLVPYIIHMNPGYNIVLWILFQCIYFYFHMAGWCGMLSLFITNWCTCLTTWQWITQIFWLVDMTEFTRWSHGFKKVQKHRNTCEWFGRLKRDISHEGFKNCNLALKSGQFK